MTDTLSNNIIMLVDDEPEITDLTHVVHGDFIIIPKGVKHRPVCKSLVKCLLIEIIESF